jgi:hypothetical protein
MPQCDKPVQCRNFTVPCHCVRKAPAVAAQGRNAQRLRRVVQSWQRPRRLKKGPKIATLAVDARRPCLKSSTVPCTGQLPSRPKYKSPLSGPVALPSPISSSPPPKKKQKNKKQSARVPAPPPPTPLLPPTTAVGAAPWGCQKKRGLKLKATRDRPRARGLRRFDGDLGALSNSRPGACLRR